MPFRPVLVVEVEDRVLRPAILVGNVESERQVFFTVLISVIGKILLPDIVIFPVNPVIPKNIVDQLLLQCPSELIN